MEVPYNTEDVAFEGSLASDDAVLRIAYRSLVRSGRPVRLEVESWNWTRYY